MTQPAVVPVHVGTRGDGRCADLLAGSPVAGRFGGGTQAGGPAALAPTSTGRACSQSLEVGG